MAKMGKYSQGSSFTLLPGKNFLHPPGELSKLERIKRDARMTELRDNPEYRLLNTIRSVKGIANKKPVTRVPLKCLE